MSESRFVNKITGEECMLLAIAKDEGTKESRAVFKNLKTLDTSVLPLSIFNQRFNPKTRGG